MSMMNDYEEDLDDFPAENKREPAESRRVERSICSRKWDHNEGSTSL